MLKMGIGTTSHQRVDAALEALGLSDKYKQKFRAQEMNDEMVERCIEDPALTPFLQEIIPVLAHRIRFLEEFKKLKMPQKEEGSIANLGESFNNLNVLQTTSHNNENDGTTPCGEFEFVESPDEKFNELPTPSLSSTPQPQSLEKVAAHEALQIIELSMLDDKENSQFILNTSALTSILAKIPSDRPLAILSIVGSSQKGKSSFLNYVLRYLTNGLEDGRPKSGPNDWMKMGWQCQDEPLEGFPWGIKTDDSADGINTGISMWSHPFTLRSAATGQEFDLLLMDSQALFDDYSSPQDWRMLMGLCLLLSSSLVFNAGSEELQEERLHFFYKVLTNARSILEQLEDTTGTVSAEAGVKSPFQQLTFLLRDWTKIQNFACGHDGGTAFIKKKLETKGHHHESHRRTRQLLQDSFDKIEACLLPHPGVKVVNEVNFDGAISGLDLKYSIRLEECIVNLMNPDHFPIKRINNNQFLTAGHLVHFLESMVEALNNQTNFHESMLMSMTSSMMIMDQLSDMIQKEPFDHQNFLDLYKTEMDKQIVEQEFYLPDQLKNFHDGAQQDVIKSLQKFLSEQDPAVSYEGEPVQDLSKKLENLFEEIMDKNIEAQSAAMKNASQNALKQFTMAMDLNGLSASEEFLEEDAMDDVLNFAEKEANRRFDSHFPDHILKSKEILQVERERFQTDLQQKKSAAQQMNAKKLTKARDKMDKIVMDTLKSFESQVLFKLENKFMLTRELKEIHSTIRKKQVESLGRNKQLYKLNDKLIKNLNGEIDFKIEAQIWPSILKRNAENKEIFESKAQNSLAEAFTLYATDVRAMVKACYDETEVVTQEEEIRFKYVGYLKTKIWPIHQKEFGDIATFNAFLVEELGRKMDVEFEQSLDYFRIRQSEDELAVREVLLEISKFYNDQMEKEFRSKPYFFPSDLDKIHLKVSMAAFNKCPDDMELTSKQKKKLEKAMLLLFKKFEEENMRRIPQDSPAVGIDLGTTCSAVAVYINGEVTVIRNESESSLTTTPSVVAFDQHGLSSTVGEAAKRQSCRNPMNTIFDAKRLIGRKFSEQSVQDDMKRWHFQVTNADGDDLPKIMVEGRNYRPEEISARVLRHMQNIAEFYLQKPVQNVVITVPANFNDGQRQATKDAAEIAGLHVMKIINEPTAAALAHHHIILRRLNDGQKRNVIVFDLGGGTFDLSCLTIEGGQVDVKASKGDMHLGGEDFDNELANYCIEYVKKTHKVDLTHGQKSKNTQDRLKAACTLRRLVNECEKAKCSLSADGCLATEIELDVLDKFGQGIHVPLTRDLFNMLNGQKFAKCMTTLQQVLDDAGMEKSKIDDIVLVGGSTRIPKIQELLRQFFDNKSLSIHKEFNPDEAVAYGAAIQAALLNGQQAASLLGEVTFSDVSPLPIGIELFTGKFDTIVPRNTKIPCSITKEHYTTVYDYQTECQIVAYEGEDRVATKNHFLGEFSLTNIPCSRAGKEPIEVTMNISDEGILHVTAICTTNKTTNDIKIREYKGRMSVQEKQRAKDALTLYK